MRNKVVSKKDGNIEIMARTLDLVDDIRGLEQLCWNCRKGFPTDCRKVADVHKLSIEDYDFIDEGVQIYNRDGEMTHFVVVKCSEFEQGQIVNYSKKPIRRRAK